MEDSTSGEGSTEAPKVRRVIEVVRPPANTVPDSSAEGSKKVKRPKLKTVKQATRESYEVEYVPKVADKIMIPGHKEYDLTVKVYIFDSWSEKSRAYFEDVDTVYEFVARVLVKHQDELKGMGSFGIGFVYDYDQPMMDLFLLTAPEKIHSEVIPIRMGYGDGEEFFGGSSDFDEVEQRILEAERAYRVTCLTKISGGFDRYVNTYPKLDDELCVDKNKSSS